MCNLEERLTVLEEIVKRDSLRKSLEITALSEMVKALIKKADPEGLEDWKTI